MDINVSQAAAQFGLNFINGLPSATQNAVLSPWSLFNLLGMILLGTVDKSKSSREIHQVWLAPEFVRNERLLAHQMLQATYKRITEHMNQPAAAPDNRSVLFEQANMVLYNKDRAPLSAAYSRDLAAYYSAVVDHFSRAEDPRGPLHERVNRWVASKTGNMITKLLEPSTSSDPSLAAVLLNAAYFKGSWLHAFEASYEKDFHGFAGDGTKRSKRVPFMRIERKFKYGQFGVKQPPGVGQLPDELFHFTAEQERLQALTRPLNCRVVSLPYQLQGGANFSMLFLLPDEPNGLAELQRKLNWTVLDAVYSSLSVAEVEVVLPKFEFEATYEPKQQLMDMGLKSIWSATGDLSPMFDNNKRDMLISKMLHKAKIRVDEKGAEAAAASFAAISFASLSYTSAFVADHPFLFIIRHNPTNMPLFMGRVSSFD